MAYEYIEKFQKLGFGLFVHFGLYSKLGKGEWVLHLHQLDKKEYNALPQSFEIDKNWAKELVKTAKNAGCKYITLTTRHHDGFSLFDTCGLSNFDAVHAACGRDLVREFVDECNAQGIVPFFYHTLLDWNHPDYKEHFPRYIDYLIDSVEILCKNYGKVGGFWFDGFWDKPNADWQFDRLYAIIRKYQPEAMIINNTGLSALGEVSHPEIDSVTFERGNPAFVDRSKRPIAGEMCQVLNDHWGYAINDCNYKSVKELLENLVDCRRYDCNFLLNTGLRGDGTVNPMDACILGEIGKWVYKNSEVVYNAKSCDIKAENAIILQGDDCYYVVIKNVPMSADPNVQRQEGIGQVCVKGEVLSAEWLDNGEGIEVVDGMFYMSPFAYGESRSIRVAKLKMDM